MAINIFVQVPSLREALSGLRGGDQCNEVADGGDVIGKAAGFSAAMAVKCTLKVEMGDMHLVVNACISMEPFYIC